VQGRSGIWAMTERSCLGSLEAENGVTVRVVPMDRASSRVLRTAVRSGEGGNSCQCDSSGCAVSARASASYRYNML
jgi:hypothetical protein